MEIKHNRNYQRIDNAIINAYKELLKEKGTPDSSITELCERARVNRTTFYKHYRGIYEITDAIESQLIYNIFNLNESTELSVEAFLTNPRPVLNVLNNNIMKDLSYYKSVFRPERMHYIIDKATNLLIEDFKKHYPKYTKKENTMLKVNLNIGNLVGSFANLYIQWFNGHFNCGLNDIADYLCRVIPAVYKDAKIPE